MTIKTPNTQPLMLKGFTRTDWKNDVALQQEMVQKNTFEKDAVPMPALNRGILYNTGGFWSGCTDTVIADVATGGSKIVQWLPTRGVNNVMSKVAHLAWVGPENYDGSETYMDYLAGLAQEDECGYGPADDWNGFEYSHSGYSVSRSSPTLKPHHWGGKYCETQPIMRVAGNNAGINISTDAEWALAKAGIGLENHMNWNVIYGDPAVANYSYDGLDKIIRPGWVAAHADGPGQVVFSDPIFIDGTSLTSEQEILNKIKFMVRKVRQRAKDRGYTLTANDYAIFMPSAHWGRISEAIAAGALVTGQNTSTTTIFLTPEDYSRELERVRSGFFGEGYIVVDGIPVPVITEDLLGSNVTLPDTTPGVVGDIYVLTRFFRGITILEHQYLNWNMFQGYPTNGTEHVIENGMLRYGWVMEANKCFYYYVETHGRLLTTMQPMQARLVNVTVSSEEANENESVNPASPDWYAFGSNRGGEGIALVTGVQKG